MSVAQMRTEGVSTQASPAIWADCPREGLNASGNGYFVHNEFLGGTVDTIASGEQRPSYGDFSLDCEDDTVVSFLADLGGVLDLETDADDNDSWAVFTRPMAKIVLNSGKKVWFEARVEMGDVTMDGGFAILLAENAALNFDVIADGAAVLIGESYVGFRVLTDDPNAIDAVFKLDGGTEVELLADVSNSTNLTAAGGTAAALTNDTAFKVGMRFDGRDRLEIFFNGFRVLTETLSTTTFPDGVAFGLILSMKTGTTAAESGAIDWADAAYQERG